MTAAEERLKEIEDISLKMSQCEGCICDYCDIDKAGFGVLSRFLRQVREAREKTYGSVSEMANDLWEAIQPKEAT